MYSSKHRYNIFAQRKQEMTLNDAIIKTLDEKKDILSIEEVYNYIVSNNLYDWKESNTTAHNTIGRALNQFSKQEASNIKKLDNGRNVFYYNEKHKDKIDFLGKHKELTNAKDNYINLSFTTPESVQSLMSILETNTATNRKGFTDPKYFSFYYTEMKSVPLIISSLNSIKASNAIINQYKNHLTKLELLDKEEKLTKDGLYLVENYSEDDIKDLDNRMKIDFYIFNLLLNKLKEDDFLHKKAKIFAAERISNTIEVYNLIPQNIREELLKNFDDENLKEVLFLQRINFNGNEVERYYRLEEEERNQIKIFWQQVKNSMPENKPNNLNAFENTIYDYIYFDKKNKMQSDAKYRCWANLKAYDSLIKLDSANQLEFINSGTVIYDKNKKIKQATWEKNEICRQENFSTEALDETGKSKKWNNFHYLNILFKGVPGTGKSHAVNNIIENFLNLTLNHDNVLRINIHSASSNSDLMQGIGISSNDSGKIIYNEKQGLILDIIKRATFNPNQPFVLVLEEIQENSLNELIGDLIYLIEDEKRSELIADDKDYNSYEELVNELVKNNKIKYFVKVPFLVSTKTDYRKMILPKNLFIFCTSNYRDDKKIIEDNLLRRFEVIEVYPNSEIASQYVKEFFVKLNEHIKKELKEEVHPDRFMIGHAIFKNIKNKKDFYRVLLKVTTEFKDIKEIEFDIFKNIIIKTTLPKKEEDSKDIIELNLSDDYFGLITQLQKEIAYEFLKENEQDISTNE